MIAVDSSVLVAILFGEPGGEALTARLTRASYRYLSVVSYVECGTVLSGRMRGDPAAAIPLLDEFLSELGVTLRGVDEIQMRLAMRARIEHGRGFGASAGLNFGDCFAYALAKALDAPLLFVGDDFSGTDIRSALF